MFFTVLLLSIAFLILLHIVEQRLINEPIIEESKEPFKIEKILFKNKNIDKYSFFIVNKDTSAFKYLDSIAIFEFCQHKSSVDMYINSSLTNKERLENYPSGRSSYYSKSRIARYDIYQDESNHEYLKVWRRGNGNLISNNIIAFDRSNCTIYNKMTQ